MPAPKTRNKAFLVAAGLLLVMAVLMISAMRQDSATVDETTLLSSGYTYWTGHRFYFVPEHPPLSQMLPALPLLVMDVKLSDLAKGLLDSRVSYPWTRPWNGPPLSLQSFVPEGCGGQWVDLKQAPFARLIAWQCSGALPLQNWYLWALPEGQLFGQMVVYDGVNDGDQMMFAGRMVEVIITLTIGLLIFLWVRRVTASDVCALVGLAAWVFHPVALGYGHVIGSDIAVALGMTAAIWLFGELMEKPGIRAALLCGAGTGVALLMKLTAILLGPIYIVLTAIFWPRLKKNDTSIWKLALIVAASAWALIFLFYFPHWVPAPPLSEAQASALGVPGWFQGFRSLLIPADFFKALALTLGHSQGGHENYLLGEWAHHGWWYYYPLAFFFKSPAAFVVLTIAGTATTLRYFRELRPLEAAAWVGAAVYVLAAMPSNVNIGVRHLLPIFPLCCVGIGIAAARWSQPAIRKCLFGVLGWQALVTLLCYPLYIQFFSEAVGGAVNGQKYLIDSNYDWGQDAKRLKQFLDDHGITHIYLDYFGTQYNIEYLKIPNTRVGPDQARQIQDGWLVVSASELMRPEWAWLRGSREPTARVADTLFVYQITGQTSPAP
jgi:hypothetical protein